MIRMVGVFLIMGATLWFGAYFAMKEKYRLQELEELERGLFYLQGQISYLSAPLAEAMESIGWKIQGQLGESSIAARYASSARTWRWICSAIRMSWAIRCTWMDA
ncbi:MAG: stage III sporulation protein AB, partial [Anaerotignum sp.]|nr:stage III sporulation protein AB [Anaerotignum sp.]